MDTRPVACGAVYPSRCSVELGGTSELGIGWRVVRSSNGRDALHVGAGGGWSRGRDEPFATIFAGGSVLVGSSGVVRLDVRYRRVADRAYRERWGEPLRQFAVGLGLGLAMPAS